MGLFKDSFQKSFKSGKLPGISGGLRSTESGARGIFKGPGSTRSLKRGGVATALDPTGTSQATIFAGQALQGGGAQGVELAGTALAIGAGTTLGPVSHMFKSDSSTKPPAVGAGPGVGAGTEEATQEARRRAIAENIARRKRSSTIGTTPLGVQGERAAIGKKRLTGE